jgi:SAM-dependent methyltransferase
VRGIVSRSGSKGPDVSPILPRDDFVLEVAIRMGSSNASAPLKRERRMADAAATASTAAEADPSIISHDSTNTPETVERRIQLLREKITAGGDQSFGSVREMLEVMEQLRTFSLGRFLLGNGGLDAEHTHAILTWPLVPNRHIVEKNMKPLERFLFTESPTMRAMQQRFQRHLSELQDIILAGGSSIASIPCGLMQDCSELDWKQALAGHTNVRMHGVDLDPKAVMMASRRLAEKGLLQRATVKQGDAWSAELPERVHAISTYGLTMYEPRDSRVVDLYRQMHKNLLEGGVLLAGFLTPPPPAATEMGVKSPWIKSKINTKAARLERLALLHVIDARWRSFRTAEQVEAQLKEAGFHQVEILWDDAGIFPTARAIA